MERINGKLIIRYAVIFVLLVIIAAIRSFAQPGPGVKCLKNTGDSPGTGIHTTVSLPDTAGVANAFGY